MADNYGKAGFEKMTGLRQRFPHLKVIQCFALHFKLNNKRIQCVCIPNWQISLAIGGWNEGSEKYSRLVANAERRKRFVKNATEFVLRYKFDGLDLDWEYPTQR